MANKPMSNQIFTKFLFEQADAQVKASKVKPISESSVELYREQRYQSSLIESQIQKQQAVSQYTNFVHGSKVALLSEAMYHIFDKVVPERIKVQENSTGIMRNMIGTYIHEHSADKILTKMETSSAMLSEMANIVNNTFKKVIESVATDDVADRGQVAISQDIKDDFFKSLDKLDTDGVESAIRDRVAVSIGEFIQKNAEDKSDIEEIMVKTKEKLDSVPEDQESLKESYNILGKRAINKIRNRKQNVFGAMVTNMAESVMKNKDLQEEYMESTGHLNVSKIVDRVSIMYCFMEMVNTARFDNVDAVFIEGVIDSLKM